MVPIEYGPEGLGNANSGNKKGKINDIKNNTILMTNTQTLLEIVDSEIFF
jgi:hypothetical protein